MKIDFDSTDLRPIIKQVISEMLSQLEADRAKLDGRIGFTEAEAAATLGIHRHTLRDARLRGEVCASRIGKRIIYSRDQLLALMEGNRIT